MKVAVIGVGRWGTKIAKEWKQIPGVEAIPTDTNTEATNTLFLAGGFPATAKTYQQIAADETIEAANICLPNQLHYPAAKALLLAGKHVLIEKPMTLTPAEAKELIIMARRKKLTLCVGHIYRFNNALEKVRDMISKKSFGKIYAVEYVWRNNEPLYADRDAAEDLAPHFFDILNYLFNEWPEVTGSIGRPCRRKSGDEITFIHAKMPSGTIASATLSWHSNDKQRRIEIYGEKISATIEAVSQKVYIHEKGTTRELDIIPNNTIRDELLHFKSCIENKRKPNNSGGIGLMAVELVNKIERTKPR